MEPKKGNSLSKKQKRALVQFIEDHPELKKSTFTKDFTYKKGQKLWEEIAFNLNSMPGANKNWDKWRKTWHDIKNSVKGKTAIIRRHITQTGGGPPTDIEISSDEQKILNLISPVTINGMPEVQESAASFEVINAIPCTDPCTSDLTESVDNTEINVFEINVQEPFCSNLNTTQKVQNSVESAVPIKILTPKKGKTVKTPIRVRRLERSIGASEHMAKIMENKNIVYTKYLNEKLEVMKRQCESSERVDAALESIAHSMKGDEVDV